MAASIHTDVVRRLQTLQNISITCATLALCILIGRYLVKAHVPFRAKQKRLQSRLSALSLWFKQPPLPSLGEHEHTEILASGQEDWDSLSDKSSSTASRDDPAPKGIPRKPRPPPLVLVPAPEDVYLPSVTLSSSPPRSLGPQSPPPHDSIIATASFPPGYRPSLDYQLTVYDGSVTKAYQDSFRDYKDRRRPVALTIIVRASDDPHIMQARYADLCTFLTCDILVAIAFLVHSIDIIFPNSSGFIFESVQHPYDNSDAAYYGLSDAHDAMRYKDDFPNLVEFGWSGALGRRRGDGTYAVLPAPFHDLLSLPYAQMRRLEFRQCLLTLSDCCLMLDSSRKVLETFVVDTVIGTSLQQLLPGMPTYPPSLWPACGPVPIRGYPAFGFVRPDGAGSEDELQCESLARLELRTTVNLDNFFRMLGAPKLAHFVYEPLGRELEYVTKRNYPWYSLTPALRSLVVCAAGVEREAARELEESCALEVVELRFCPPCQY